MWLWRKIGPGQEGRVRISTGQGLGYLSCPGSEYMNTLFSCKGNVYYLGLTSHFWRSSCKSFTLAIDLFLQEPVAAKSFLKFPYYSFTLWRLKNPPLVIVVVAGGHTSEQCCVPWAIFCRAWKESSSPQILEINDFTVRTYSGRGSTQHAGDIPSIFFGVFVFVFIIFFKVHWSSQKPRKCN